MNKYTWKDEIIASLQELGGVGSLDEILSQIIKRGNLDLTLSNTPKKTISQTLQTHSLSTDYGKENIFHSIYGVKKSKGIWGLVDNTLNNIGINITDDDDGFAEGKKVLRQHIDRERNATLRKKAKERFIHQHGRLYCECCGFDFEKTYGELGKDYIEAHHIKPISAMQDGERTKVEDMVMLCSNCHRMIHRKRPWVTKEKLKEIING